MNEECPICLEPIGDKNVMTTDCGHTFHASCMIKNLRVSGNCPMCRNVLDDEPRPVGRDHAQGEEGLWMNFTDDDVDELVDLLTERNGRNLTAAEESVNDILNVVSEESRGVRIDRVHTRIRDYVNEIMYDFTHILREWAAENENRDNVVPPPPLSPPPSPPSPPPPPPMPALAPIEVYDYNNLYYIDINNENQSGLSLSQVEYILMND